MTIPLLQRLLLSFKGSRAIKFVNLTTVREIGGTAVVVPLVGQVGFDNLSPSETWLDVWLPQMFKRRTGVFVDVGVNVGQTLLKVKTAFPQIAYVGFEPNAVCVHYTQRLIELNHFQGCTLLPVGLSNRTALLPFFMRHEHDVAASVVEGFRPLYKSPQRTYVPVFDGDSVLEQLNVSRVGVIKIDVEGAELEVAEGLRRTIRRDRPFIFCEILPVFPNDEPKRRFREPRQNRLILWLREMEYVLYRILPDANALRLTDIEPHDDVKLTNYLFAPAEDALLVDGGVRPRSDDRS